MDIWRKLSLYEGIFSNKYSPLYWESLKIKGSCSTRADVVHNALRFYEYFIEYSEEGYLIELANDHP